MSLVQRLIQRFAGSPKAATSVDSSLLWGGADWSAFVRGNEVGEKDARSVAAVSACCDLIGGSIASLPLHFYRRMPDGQRQRYTPELWWLFNERASNEYSAAAFWQYMSDSRLLHGDGFARIVRASRYSPTVVGVEPWHPSLVEVDRVDGRLVYTLYGKEPGDLTIVVDQDDMLHFPGAGFDGKRSMSAIRYALRHAAGIAKAADDQAAQNMEDGARPDFAIEVPGEMTPDAREVLRNSWQERHSGKGAKKAPVVLAGGMKLHQLTMSAEDAQLLGTRQFQIEEICRVFGVPPFMIGHNEKTTSWGSGVEQMSIGFVKYTLQRHLVSFEQEINHKFFKTSRNFAEFATAGLERGDIKTRNESYRIALGRAGEPGWMTVNEVRALENLPPIEGGNTLANESTADDSGREDDGEDSPTEQTQ